MEIGCNVVPFGDQTLEEVLEYLDGLGAEAVELGSGGVLGQDFLPRDEYLDNPDKQAELHQTLDDYGFHISALSTHDNPLHPDEEKAEQSDTDLRESIRLADQLDVDVVCAFSGLPAGGPDDNVPNWITAPWPSEHNEAWRWQWEEKTVPYWQEIGDLAAEHDVKIGIEMHPNMMIYEPTGLIDLREETNEYIGANLDPSQLFWHGVDIPETIRYLGEHDAIHHFHAKDSKLNEPVSKLKGVQDPKMYTKEPERSWLFRTIGYGHGEQYWKNIVSELRMAGYDGTLSVEHEDSLTSTREGIEKSMDVLNRAVFETEPGEAFWAEGSLNE
ncbi:sugar phosphate isomerase/epimerase family protein [Halomicroarcula sp. GCM10025324]|jgi:DNA-(apurinic or apyrimidinic site) lyase|uniref:sugar phosphate isomerase/epimerase family protein n=1 Tax=Haloarcula TaxID=2237 RepID=UPI0023E75801|nr:sugar phosphate isomerase/epimerase [Halomicroarcula sp. ZS-22-S1]